MNNRTYNCNVNRDPNNCDNCEVEAMLFMDIVMFLNVCKNTSSGVKHIKKSVLGGYEVLGCEETWILSGQLEYVGVFISMFQREQTIQELYLLIIKGW